ncbi:MAG: riboflavin biosynthesis protein RibF [bacterium]
MKRYRNGQVSSAGPMVWGIGVFDGVHRGHQALFQVVCELAAATGADPGVLTFEPHPLEVLQGARVPRLTTLDEKLELLEGLGVREAWVVAFDDAFAALPAEAFLEEYLAKHSLTRGAVVGFDFTFGKDATGEADSFKEWTGQHGIRGIVVPAVKSGSLKIGSSTIRELLSTGDTTQANALLGRPFFVTGPVVKGEGRGKDIGFPTVNLALPAEKIIPMNGVYVVAVRFHDSPSGAGYRGVCNIGFRPTFETESRADRRPTLEVFIDGLSGDLYSRILRVEFLKFLRRERKFDTIDLLREQIGKDVEEMKQIEYSEAN